MQLVEESSEIEGPSLDVLDVVVFEIDVIESRE